MIDIPILYGLMAFSAYMAVTYLRSPEHNASALFVLVAVTAVSLIFLRAEWRAGGLLANYTSVLAVLLVPVVVIAIKWWRSSTARWRAERLQAYSFPPGLARKVKASYPHLDDKQVGMVMSGLRSYFQITQAAGRNLVAMPSQAVDVAWHEFILFTRGYRKFCLDVLGRFLDHTPAEHMASDAAARQGLRRAWFQACKLEGIDPKTPARLPLLFALDSLLAIPDGFSYDLDCAKGEGAVPGSGSSFCASDFGCSSSSSGCGGSAGDGGSDGGGGDGCGGGCGGGD